MTESTQPGGRESLAWLWAGLGAGLAYLVVLLGIIATDRIPERAGFDDIMCHEPTIREFARQWPRLDFTDYLSATTPGYHLLLAMVVKFVAPERHVLQGVGALIASGWIGLMVAGVARRAGPWLGVAFVLPIAFSAYVVQSGAYLLPDNVSWLLLYAGLVLCLGTWSVRGALGFGLVLLLAVLVRQPLLWLAGVAWAAAWLSPTQVRGGARLWATALREKFRTRLWRTGLAIGVSLPAMWALWYFVSIWHGLTVPRFQGLHQALGYSTPVFVLANVGFSSLFFGASLWPVLRQVWSRARGLVLAAGVSGAALGALQPSTMSFEAGRFSGLWTIGSLFPSVGHVSLFMFSLATVGGVALLGWLMMLGLRQRLILVVAILGFVAAQTMNHLTAQRYVEPFLLMLIPLGASRVVALVPPAGRRWLLVGPLLYVGFMLVVNAQAFRSSMTIESYPRDTAYVEGGPYVRPEDRASTEQR